ncbi:hypothetical protein IFM89_012093, partial [Coptis chinensis]
MRTPRNCCSWYRLSTVISSLQLRTGAAYFKDLYKASIPSLIGMSVAMLGLCVQFFPIIEEMHAGCTRNELRHTGHATGFL